MGIKDYLDDIQAYMDKLVAEYKVVHERLLNISDCHQMAKFAKSKAIRAKHNDSVRLMWFVVKGIADNIAQTPAKQKKNKNKTKAEAFVRKNVAEERKEHTGDTDDDEDD